MGKISVLDCTLRDGGYINNWKFGKDAIKNIGKKIVRSGIEYFEVGFIKDIAYDEDFTIFSGNESVVDIIAPKDKNTIYVGMVDMGNPIPVAKLGKRREDAFDGIRVIFKKDKIQEGFEYCKELIELGYITMAQLVGTNEYSDKELINTIELFNEIEISALAIVDTFGLIKRKDFLRMIGIIDHNLRKDVALCYHSHNNLQQAMGNASAMTEQNLSRDIIIDACVFGMGRGAGNLNLELFVQYLNEDYDKSYRIEPLLEIIDEYLNEIYSHEFWGYSVPFYLSATNGCHPNYAKYFAEKGTLTVKAFNEILRSIPKGIKEIYSKENAEKIYLDFQQNLIDDNDTLEKLRHEMSDKEILLLGPGRNLLSNIEKIEKYIKNKNLVTIALNFIPDKIASDYVFSCHIRRYSHIQGNDLIKKIITSNIRDAVNYDYMVNFSSFASKNPEIIDNSGIMCVKLLVELGVKKVYLAGLDGYDVESQKNFINSGLEYSYSKEMVDIRNNLIKNDLKMLANNIEIEFVTDSKYQ